MHMRLSKPIKLTNRGDTIVEVLICLALVSLILAGAYSLTNQNVRQIQDTNERSQALQLAQEQIERLRIFVPAQIAAGQSTALANQCLDSGASPQSPSSPQNPDDCDVSPSGSLATDCSSPFCYKIVIVAAAANSYQVIVTWPSLVAGGTSQVTEYYRPS